MNGLTHMKYMALGGAGMFGILLLLGLPAGNAAYLAVLLVCPLMVVFMMGGGHSGSDAKDDHETHQH